MIFFSIASIVSIYAFVKAFSDWYGSSVDLFIVEARNIGLLDRLIDQGDIL